MSTRTGSSALAVPDELTSDELRERLTELAIASNADDAKAKDLLTFCRTHPVAWETLQDLEQDAIESWLTLLAPGKAGDVHKCEWKKEHIAQQLKRRRKALRAEGKSPLESMLIERVLSAWLQTMHADAYYARWLNVGGSIKEGEYFQRRAERAQRQLLRAVQSLATVRKLIGPSIRAGAGAGESEAQTPLGAQRRGV